MRTQVLAAVGLALGLGIATGPHAAAQPRGSSGSTSHDDQAARLLFNSAREAFEAGDYPTALARFEQAYQLSARPALLYNIATTLDRLRRDAEALAAFERYLELVPDSPNRGEIEARVAVLRAAIQQEEARAAERARIEAEREAAEWARIEAERRAQAEREAQEGIPMWATFTVGGAGVGSLVVGVTFHIVTGSRNNFYQDYVAQHQNDPIDQAGDNLANARALYDHAIKARNVTIGLYAATAALGAGVGAMIPFTRWGGGSDGDTEPTPEAPSGQAGLQIGPGSVSIGVTHRF